MFYQIRVHCGGNRESFVLHRFEPLLDAPIPVRFADPDAAVRVAKMSVLIQETGWEYDLEVVD